MALAGNPSRRLIATHLGVLHLMVVGSILDYFQTGALRRNPNSHRRLHYYSFLFVWLWAATAVACWAQGTKGVVSTSIAGLIFTAILIATGSLWPAMFYHAAVDMSVLLYWRPKPVVA